MFKHFIVSVFLAPIMATAIAVAEPASSFNGTWSGYGYKCYDAQGQLFAIEKETIEISYSEDRVVAVKVIGDDCVTSGNVTWYSMTGAEIDMDRTYTATVHMGSPTLPNSGWSEASLDFVSAREVTVYGSDWRLTFMKDEADAVQRRP